MGLSSRAYSDSLESSAEDEHLHYWPHQALTTMHRAHLLSHSQSAGPSMALFAHMPARSPAQLQAAGFRAPAHVAAAALRPDGPAWLPCPATLHVGRRFGAGMLNRR
jgi:hypothetical protein